VAGVARWIGQHVHRDERGDDAARTIVEGRGSPLGRARLFVAALRGSGIPARLAVGAVRSGDHWSAQFLPQAYVDRWLAADLDRGGLTPDSADHTILTTRTSGLRFEYNALLAPLGKPTP
jgi:transglutaminase-like putative cysteine protease